MEMPRGRLAAVFASFALLFAASSVQAQVVISQVYGGGGNSGATLKNDFIELRNNGPTAVDLTGWSVQYASSTGTTWNGRTNLSGSIPAGGFYLIQQAQGAGGTVDLPTPDATGTIAMAGTAGKVALSRSTTALTGACPTADANVVDFVGFGSAANCFEGSAPTGTLSNTTAALRGGDGSIDTNNNGADFAVGAPNPRNSGAEPPEPPDPPLALTIAQIQGNGLLSPHNGKRVVTEGIVTAIKFNNGFFLQAANDDGDPATSDAVFVFTSSAPPATAAVGNRVRVTGTVEEYTPSSNPHQLAITEIVTPTVEVLETGLALPAAIELTAAELSPDALPGTLERLEGMRVSVAQSVVIAPSGGSIDENDALSFSDGVFHVALPGVARPFREAGIGVMDAITLPAGKNPPRFDTNQERLMVRSRGQVGAQPLSVDTGAEVAGLLGVLDYFAGTWALLPDVATPPTVSGGRLPEAVNDPHYDEVTVGSFNLLRLFDEVNDSNGAVTLTPEALDKRLAKAALAICDYLKTPDILGAVEVENLRVLQLLSERIDATCAARPGYVPYLQPGNDVGGINVGFLVSSRLTADGVARVEVLDVAQFGKETTLANPNGTTSLLNDRPPLRLRARVHQDATSSYPLTVIVNHLRSLNDINDTLPGSSGWATGGERVRVKRGAQAVYLAQLVEEMQQANPDEKIVLVGDFNAFEFNDGYVDVMGIIRGDAAPEDQVLTWMPSPLTVPLVDGSQLIADPAQRYSYSFEGNAQTLDHVLVNESLVMDAALRVDHARINADFGVDNFGDASLAVRSSDHDPVRLSIRVPSFARADLSATVSADRADANVGDTVRYTATVRNAGPGAASPAAFAFVFSAELSPSLATLPAGWSCAAPEVSAGTTRVACTVPSLAVGDEATFAVDAVVPASTAGATLGLGVSANSTVLDPANGDNTAAVSVAVAALPQTRADLSVKLLGAALPLRRGTIATLLVPVRNAGPDAAEQVTVRLTSNVDARYAAVAAPNGWSCTRVQDTTDGAAADCTRRGAMPRGVQTLAFALVVPGKPKRGTELEFDATVSSTTTDPNPTNNHDRLIQRIR
ncbi:lamin tail domain-containing protein [Pseudoxanthomonas mexicana]|uniref:Lamin tail domain-containing protein n=1 Tax=Pseudoxanthomonas mexicana TaxID=128785 RepID=A0A7G9TFW0_PSEMX|nr:lamin tail domain-containing protein [Pseudoxanthomonas mexicana]QNN78985.1 lamin tail domain-containing protein [Pseudoxanthomonas mexicana]